MSLATPTGPITPVPTPLVTSQRALQRSRRALFARAAAPLYANGLIVAGVQLEPASAFHGYFFALWLSFVSLVLLSIWHKPDAWPAAEATRRRRVANFALSSEAWLTLFSVGLWAAALWQDVGQLRLDAVLGERRSPALGALFGYHLGMFVSFLAEKLVPTMHAVAPSTAPSAPGS